jgi:hypothetical protein
MKEKGDRDMSPDPETPDLVPRLRPGGDGEALLKWLTTEIAGVDECAPLVHELARVADRLQEVRAKISSQGISVGGPRGRSMANPLLQIETKLIASFDKLWRSLGLADQPPEDRRPVGRPSPWNR